MSRQEVGLVILDTSGCRGTDLVLQTRLAMGATPAGRVLGAVFDLPDAWAVSENVEGAITDTVLGLPEERTDNPEWEYFGSIAVRVCRVRPDIRSVVKEQGVLLFRRAGELAYRRRLALDEKALERARLDTHHPVFTRDVANNVWHVLRSSEVTSRLAMLLAWPDEVVVHVAANRARRLKVKRPNLDQALVGVPEKVKYDFSGVDGASAQGPAALFPS